MELALCGLLAVGSFDVVALVETWLSDIPSTLRRACTDHGYSLYFLPALLSESSGRDRRGILLVVRRWL